MEIRIREVPAEYKKNPKEVLAGPLGFGKLFTDRMFQVKWTEEKGWHDAEICAHMPLQLDPAALVLHYAQELFEGMKAYYLTDGSIGLFRPEMNCKRLNASARRLVMPEIPVEDQMQAIEMLVRELRDWIPTQPGYSLYIRPTMIATNPLLGVQPAREYLYFVICSPVAAYFERGFQPVRVATSLEFVRAAVGGLGQVKAGANYAASLMAAAEAKKRGYDQVVWLDAKEHRYIEEMGGMNVFVVYGDTLKTCKLTGSILPGITRDSILHMASDLGLKVEETLLDVNEVVKDFDSGKATEAFACGTAAVVTAISHFQHDGTEHKVGDGQPGDVTTKLYETLTGIQSGKLEDRYSWVHRL